MSETILVVDDEESIRSALAGILEDEGYRTLFANDGIEALEHVQRELPDLALLDIWMPRLDGLETLQRLKQLYPALTVVMMSGHGTIETAVRATKLGAYDFVEKPLSLEKVILTIENALGMNRLKEENVALRGMLLKGHEMVGVSPSMRRIHEHIRLVAPTGASVLISGENGTGKELLARCIHYHSPRRDKPFVEINCAAIPGELIDSELFGHERGALAGAAAQKKGKFDLADGGTIFLDDVADMPLKSQAKVLRILREGKFERVGGTRTVEVDVRVVAAANKLLEEEMRTGKFLGDLFYWLNVVPFTVPALRERKEDIPLLIEHYLEMFCRMEGRERKLLLPEAVGLMQCYEWPGNVRELKNIIERLVIMTPGRAITASQLPASIVCGPERGPGASKRDRPLDYGSLREAREEFEKEFIAQKLEENDWDISKTAGAIELERSNLHRKIKGYGIGLKK
jgi:two-component system nitrogen regulation response regulator NtrX